MNQLYKRTCPKCGDRAQVDTSQKGNENRCSKCGNDNAFNFDFILNNHKQKTSTFNSTYTSKTSKPARKSSTVRELNSAGNSENLDPTAKRVIHLLKNYLFRSSSNFLI
jgi:DNA-directed RNA polymerase subunit M/transcription elongation factor TFIIS